MTRISYALSLLFFLSLTQSTLAELSEQRTNTLKLQLFLNTHDFATGYLDGRAGKFTMLAIRNYNLKNERDQTDFRYAREAQTAIAEPLITTIIPSSAEEFINANLSSDKEEQAELKFLPYRSYAEYAAERFQTSVSFLKEINGAKKINALGPRSAIKVPNVEPFLIENLKHGRSHKASEEFKHRYLIIDTEINQLFIFKKEFLVPAVAKTPAEPQQFVESEEEMSASLKSPEISIEQEPEVQMIPAKLSDEQLFTSLTFKDLIASFPITPGKPQFIRRGYWKIKNSVELPVWRYDKSLLETGEIGTESLLIPGGPNNPVGVVWNGLTRKGIGIHGTSSPETIGRSQSAGCIRLANWDVIKLTQFVRPGNKVWLR